MGREALLSRYKCLVCVLSEESREAFVVLCTCIVYTG